MKIRHSHLTADIAFSNMEGQSSRRVTKRHRNKLRRSMGKILIAQEISYADQLPSSSNSS